ncbi:MAG TPA: tetratricopeptide repeat protein [Candidatus Saccharimonadales bacterium]|nr:tetratricopeptide repeat protein [Candidatus Saccharimonadales bacterium]
MRRGVLLALFVLFTCGAFYEWGGPARRGVRELKKKRYEEALQDFKSGRADFPGAAVVPYDEGLAHLGRGAADSAAVRFREAARLRGEAPREAALYNLGNLAMRGKDYGSAARSYREALRLRPRDADAKRNLEEALRQLRQPNPEDRKNPPSGGGGPQTPRGNERPQPSPGPSGPTPTPPPRGSAGAFTKEEAERWLEALESERRARRQEEKGQTSQENGNRDW